MLLCINIRIFIHSVFSSSFVYCWYWCNSWCNTYVKNVYVSDFTSASPPKKKPSSFLIPQFFVAQDCVQCLIMFGLGTFCGFFFFSSLLFQTLFKITNNKWYYQVNNLVLLNLFLLSATLNADLCTKQKHDGRNKVWNKNTKDTEKHRIHLTVCIF